jgi:MoaA/NifB/PqqE/SkfB family radical SAM enzyme
MNNDINDIITNKSFCLAPWVHTHILPTGNAYPCCFWDYGQSHVNFGNINDEKTIQTLMNGENFKKIRKDFIEGTRVAGCNRCYKHEDSGQNFGSMRSWFNDNYADDNVIKSVMDSKNKDGYIDNIQIRYLDIRFGNICNLKCRMCGHGLSSSWYEEDKAAVEQRSGIFNKEKFIHTNCLDEVMKYLPYLDEIYFAGGEPFLYPEHLPILEKLIELGKTDVRIKYNSNLTTLTYKGVYILDVLSKFSKVSIGASIDSKDSPGEFIRTGLKWKIFEENYNTIMTKYPHINLLPSPSIGILNIESFIDFNKYCVNNGWINGHVPFIPNFVAWPQIQNISILPDWYKKKVEEMYLAHIEWLKTHPNQKASISQIQGMYNIINFMYSNSIDTKYHEKYLVELWERLWSWNDIAGLDWTNQLPGVWNFFVENSTKSDVWEYDSTIKSPRVLKEKIKNENF